MKKQGELIGVSAVTVPHQNNIKVERGSIIKIAILELPEVCPVLADWDQEPVPERLPKAFQGHGI
jgi:hypothetical protein